MKLTFIKKLVRKNSSYLHIIIRCNNDYNIIIIQCAAHELRSAITVRERVIIGYYDIGTRV